MIMASPRFRRILAKAEGDAEGEGPAADDGAERQK
jgi:hypothetical protein